MSLKRLIFALLISLMIPLPVQAQAPTYPIYVIQPGDTLNAVAILFSTTTDEIIQLNNITNPNFISEGTELFIPGLQGISGYLVKTAVPLGETYYSLLKHSPLSASDLARINRLTSPNEVFSGAPLITAQSSAETTLLPFISIQPGVTLLEAAVLQGISPASLVNQNTLQGSWDIVNHQTLYSAQNAEDASLFTRNSPIRDINISPLPLMQGKTIVIKVKTNEPLTLTGSLNDHELHFFPAEENEYIALQGIDRRVEPGTTVFSLSAADAIGEVYSFSQNILLVKDFFPRDPMLYVDPRSLDPTVTEPEELLVSSLTTPATPIRRWDGYFYKPLDRTDCTSSVFGSIRGYNDSAFIYTHGGMDFIVCASNLNIYAVAPGTVVLAEFLEVRGNAVVIDHGWGVYSGYWHQSELMVKVGDQVEAGQIIGQVGTTGRSNGAHLHLEMIVGGVQVEPLDWLTQIFP